MSGLDKLPDVDSFFGLDLATGSYIVAAISIVHPMTYGYTIFAPMSYLLVTIWLLIALYFAASIILFCGLLKSSALLCSIWIWYVLVFVGVMFVMMILLALLFTSKRQRSRVVVSICGMLWYLLTIYFVLVVNSHRKRLERKNS